MNDFMACFVKLSDVDMIPGGVLRVDRKLSDISYLTEGLSQDDFKGVLLPFSRVRGTWDGLMFLLVSYTAIMLPIQLGYRDVSATMPRALLDLEVAMDFLFLFDVSTLSRRAHRRFARHGPTCQPFATLHMADRPQLPHRFRGGQCARDG